jgi:putative transposase
MHAYLATICRDLGGEALRVGGVANHVHIVTTLPRTLSQAQMVEGIKKPSSKWIKTLETRYRSFFWQRGYGAFSVSPSQLDAVLQYVEAQEEHHRTRTFQEEYRELLRRHGLESTSAMCGIKERTGCVESRFQRSFAMRLQSLGRLPQAGITRRF